MSIKLNLINDPNDAKAKTSQMPTTLTLRHIEPQTMINNKEGKPITQKVKIPEDSINLAKKETIKGFEKEVNIQGVLNHVHEGIEQKRTRKLYYVGSQKNKIFCGPVIQIIPISTFSHIGSGKSTYSLKAPIKDNHFQFERQRQVSIKVGKRLGKDFVVVVGRNGCVVIESHAYALFNMPVYVVEPTGDYYYLNHGNRRLELGPGSHFILYTRQAPVVFATIQKADTLKEKKKLRLELSN
jgi:hypothetical protein